MPETRFLKLFSHHQISAVAYLWKGIGRALQCATCFAQNELLFSVPETLLEEFARNPQAHDSHAETVS